MDASPRTVTCYTARDAAAAAGVAYFQICRWDTLGVLSPSVATPDGAGSRRLYSRDDLVWLIAASRLASIGFTTLAIRSIVAKMRSTDAGERPFVALVDGGATAPESVGELPALLHRTESMMLVIDLKTARAQVDSGAPSRAAPAAPPLRPRAPVRRTRRRRSAPRPFAARSYGAGHGHQTGPHH